MRKYCTWLDPRAMRERARMRRQAPRDIASGTLRLALHLSDQEYRFLETKNPESLGLPPGPDHDAAWARFISHPDSEPYRVNKV
jgi:hypothetical protein